MENQELKDKLLEITTKIDNLALIKAQLYVDLADINDDLKCLEGAKSRIESALATLRGIDESDLRDRIAAQRNIPSPQPGTEGNGTKGP